MNEQIKRINELYSKYLEKNRKWLAALKRESGDVHILKRCADMSSAKLKLAIRAVRGIVKFDFAKGEYFSGGEKGREVYRIAITKMSVANDEIVASSEEEAIEIARRKMADGGYSFADPGRISFLNTSTIER